jgi:hypothetical protein
VRGNTQTLGSGLSSMGFLLLGDPPLPPCLELLVLATCLLDLSPCCRDPLLVSGTPAK